MSDSRSTRSDVLGSAAAGFLVLFFCLLLLWHNPLVFWNDDYELSVLPVFADMARSWSEGHWPILSPYSWVCGNLAGEFQYGVFSVFVNAVIIVVWNFPLAFPQQAAAVSIAHLFALAVGAFLLARDREFSIPLSTFVALVAALSGWIICWGATDWFGALGAFTWLPWAWWGAERALDVRRTKWRFLWPAPFIYLLVTGGFPYTVLMLLLLIAWLSIKTMWERLRCRDGRDTKVPPTLAALPMLVGVALGFGLSAPAWLALLDLVRGSARELQSAAAHWQWRVPPAALPGLILPSWTVNWTDFSSRNLPHTAVELTCGLVAPIALLTGLVWRGRPFVRRIKWELILLVVVLLLCMTPTAGLFRWSFRWLPFFHMVLAICAAEALRIFLNSPVSGSCASYALSANGAGSRKPGATPQGINVPSETSAESANQRTELSHAFSAANAFRNDPGALPQANMNVAPSALRRCVTPSTAALALIILTAFGIWIFHAGGEYSFPLVWIFIALAALWILLEFLLPASQFRQWTPAVITFLALLTTYLYVPTNCGVPRYNFSQELLKPAPLDPARLYLSIYPWAELTYCTANKPQPVGQTLRPGSTSMWAGLHFINGYSPIRPNGVAREFATSIHGEINPDVGSYLLNSQAGTGGELDLLGVDGIVVASELDIRPQPSSEWEEAISTDQGRVFHRRGAPFTRVRSVTSLDGGPNEQFVSATISNINDSRNSVEADVDVPSGDWPALLTFSRPYFRGYEARLSNQKLAVTSYRGLFPIVEVPAGAHGRLVLAYRPYWLIWGGAVAVVCAFAVVLSFLAAIYRRASARPITPS